MQLENITPTTYKVTLHAYELATLISAVRWIADGAEGELSPEVREQMERILNEYDKATKGLQKVDGEH